MEKVVAVATDVSKMFALIDGKSCSGDDLNALLADGWYVKMISAAGGSDVFGSFIVLTDDPSFAKK